MAFERVVIAELGKNLTSIADLTSKFCDWGIDPKDWLHLFHNLKKEEMLGLLGGTCHITPKSKESNILFLSVTSDGTTGEEWVTFLKNAGIEVDSDVRRMLQSEDFKPTVGVTTSVEIYKNVTRKNMWSIKDARVLMHDSGRSEVSLEVLCLILVKYKPEEIRAMGLQGLITGFKKAEMEYSDERMLLCFTSNRIDRSLRAYSSVSQFPPVIGYACEVPEKNDSFNDGNRDG